MAKLFSVVYVIDVINNVVYNILGNKISFLGILHDNIINFIQNVVKLP